MRRSLVLAGAVAALIALPVPLAAPAAADNNGRAEDKAHGPMGGHAEARSAMVRDVTSRAEATAPVTGIDSIAPRILSAMENVRRHAFVPKPLRRYAYLATPLPLGHGQNIASPYIVALMTHLAGVDSGQAVLETGTGAGYHAAVLSEIGARVVSVEVVPELANEARLRLVETGHPEVETHIGDGYYGWSEKAPYDAIIVKEALDHVPDPLVEQLAPDGRLVMPLGPLDGRQHLTVITKSADGQIDRRRVLPVRFSPLQGGQRT
jgi:protein-L-isoaspartate(D-aspartate) O-methyltransferase